MNAKWILSFIFFLSVVLNVITPANADSVEVCGIRKCMQLEIDDNAAIYGSNFAPNSIKEIVAAISKFSGITPNFVVMADPRVPNAVATVHKGRQLIVYNPAFIQNVGDEEEWNVTAVLAHEIGHHLHGHYLDGRGSLPHKELEADEYSGFIMAALGATLREAQFNWLGKNTPGSFTHPPSLERLAAIGKGWNSFHDKFGGGQAPDPVVVVNRPVPPFGKRDCRNITFGDIEVSGEICVSSVSHLNEKILGARALSTHDDNLPWVTQPSSASALFEFERPVDIEGLRVQNGDNYSEDTYYHVGRAKEITIKFSDGTKEHLDLPDSPNFENYFRRYRLAREHKGIKWMLVEILDLHQGERLSNRVAVDYFRPIFVNRN